MLPATAAVVALFGVGLLAGGVWLAALGGSWYYLLAGLGFQANAGLLAGRRRAALGVYALVVAGSLAWAIWEVGFDWWQLAPRGGIVALVGLWLLTPWVAGRLRRTELEARPGALSAAGLPLSLAVAASLAVAGYASWGIRGRLPERHAAAGADAQSIPPADWPHYGRTAGGGRYGPLDEITPANVARLEKAWEYRTGDIRGPDDPVETTYEVTPIKVDDTLYLCTPHHIAIALDPETGQERCRFDPQEGKNRNRQHQTCRGVTYYALPGLPAGADCRRRIYLPTADARPIALDADRGTPCPGFGEGGTVDLWANMPHRQEGFYYSTSPAVVAAVVDWFSRRVLSWRLSITQDTGFCLEAVEEALARHGRPAIFNTDQGSQFTSAAFTGLLLANGIAISMDGRGAWRDNVFVERLWRSVKYEEVYLRAYDSVGQARAAIGRYLSFYNGRRPHSSLGGRTPDQAYFDGLPQLAAA